VTVCVHRGLDAVDFVCSGPRTSYLVDHFSVFSYPGHSTFLFLHCKQEPAVSSHLSCALVSLDSAQRRGFVGRYPFKLASTASVPGLRFLHFRILCSSSLPGQCVHLCLQVDKRRYEMCDEGENKSRTNYNTFVAGQSKAEAAPYMRMMDR
jgi:hypothetical protein